LSGQGKKPATPPLPDEQNKKFRRVILGRLVEWPMGGRQSRSEGSTAAGELEAQPKHGVIMTRSHTICG
jgi:hypothetical protein